MPENDWIHSLHKYVAKQLHKPAGFIGWYTQGAVGQDTYAVSLEKEIRELEHILDSLGFYRNPTAYLTYRNVHFEDAENKDYTEGSWVKYVDGLLGEYQVHITVYSAYDDGFVDVYAHHETNWFRHPYKHLFNNDYDAEKGIRIVKDMFSDCCDTVQRSAEDRGWM